MELYNSIIEKIDGLLGSTQPKRYEYNPDRCWEDVGGNQLVMMKEAAYELGGDNKPVLLRLKALPIRTRSSYMAGTSTRSTAACLLQE